MADDIRSDSSYPEEGFVLVPGLFGEGEIQAVLDEAQGVFRTQLRRRGLLDDDDGSVRAFEDALYRYFEVAPEEFQNCGKQIQHLCTLHRLGLHPAIADRLHELGLAHPNISTRPVLFFNSRFLAKEEVYWRVFPHQDWRSMQRSLDSVVVWVPLTDIGRDLGALEVVPGSHRLGLVTDEVVHEFSKTDRFADRDFVALEVRRGDAVFLSSLLVHRSGTNSTRSIRWSCHFRFNILREPTFVDRGYPHPYAYRPQDELITPGFPTRSDIELTFG